MIDVNKVSIQNDIVRNFTEVMKTVTSVTSSDSVVQTIQYHGESVPDSVISGKTSYPIIIIEPALINWTQFTMTKKQVSGTIKLEVYATRNQSADLFIGKMINAVETSKPTFRTNGLSMVELDDTDFDNEKMVGDIKTRQREATFRFTYRFEQTRVS